MHHAHVITLTVQVTLPDGPSRGCKLHLPRDAALLTSDIQDIQEIFGAHYELPELGPLGANGLANVRDFESPVASFDIDQSPWESE
jgi:homogentisate 1,2-dioxygenase